MEDLDLMLNNSGTVAAISPSSARMFRAICVFVECKGRRRDEGVKGVVAVVA